MLILHNSIKAIVTVFLSKGVIAKFKPFITVNDFFDWHLQEIFLDTQGTLRLLRLSEILLKGIQYGRMFIY